MSLIDDSAFRIPAYVNQFFASLKLSSNSYLGAPKFTRNMIAFKNGVFNLETRSEGFT